MIVKKVHLERNWIEENLPKNVLVSDHITEPLVYAVFDHEDIVGMAVYEESEAFSKEAMLKYFFVFPEYRFKGVAKELIRQSGELLKESGYLYITVKYKANAEDILLKMDLFTSLGFEALKLNTHFLCYNS